MKDEWTARKWESPSDWVALVPGRVVGFGERVRGEKPSTNEKHE